MGEIDQQDTGDHQPDAGSQTDQDQTDAHRQDRKIDTGYAVLGAAPHAHTKTADDDAGGRYRDDESRPLLRRQIQQ